jgi:hypothetical protein
MHNRNLKYLELAMPSPPPRKHPLKLRGGREGKGEGGVVLAEGWGLHRCMRLAPTARDHVPAGDKERRRRAANGADSRAASRRDERRCYRFRWWSTPPFSVTDVLSVIMTDRVREAYNWNYTDIVLWSL